MQKQKWFSGVENYSEQDGETMKKKIKQPPMGIVQVFIDNGKVIFHPDKGRIVKWFLPEPRDFGVYGCPEAPRSLRMVLMKTCEMGWIPVTGFVWCGWGWEMRVQKIVVNKFHISKYDKGCVIRAALEINRLGMAKKERKG